MRASTIKDPLPQIFYPVSLNVTGRACVVIGNDREAIEKEEALREAGADVRIIRSAEDVRDADVVDAFFVISTPQDAVLSSRLRELANHHRFLLCTIDQPAFGFVAMQAIVRAGPVQVSISTTGQAPRVGKRLKLALERALDKKFEQFIECLSMQKLRNRKRLAEQPQLRRSEMIKAADGFDVDITVRYPEWFEHGTEEALTAGFHVG